MSLETKLLLPITNTIVTLCIVRVRDTTQLSHASERRIPTEHGVSERPSKIVKSGRDIAAKLMIGDMIGGISVLCVLVASDWVRLN